MSKSLVNELNPYGFREVEISISDIKRNEANPRKISKRDQSELRNSLQKFGLIDKPIVNANNDLIAGHQRLALLEEQGIKRVKVMMPELQLSEKDSLELLIRHNKNTGEWDFEKLNLFAAEDLIAAGFDYSELNKGTVMDEEMEEALKDQEPVYPITPRMSEKHSYVLIVVDNEIEKANLETFFELETVSDYKTQRVGTGRVLTFAKFKELTEKKIQQEAKKVSKVKTTDK